MVSGSSDQAAAGVSEISKVKRKGSRGVFTTGEVGGVVRAGHVGGVGGLFVGAEEVGASVLTVGVIVGIIVGVVVGVSVAAEVGIIEGSGVTGAGVPGVGVSVTIVGVSVSVTVVGVVV
jgi:hypothetical protein